MPELTYCPVTGLLCPDTCWRTPETCRRQPKQPRRTEILRTAEKLINGDRNESYGDASEDFTRTGKLWAAVLGLEHVSAEQVALCMALVKIGRLCHSPDHLDSWVDGCGYLALGGEIGTSARAKRNAEPKCNCGRRADKATKYVCPEHGLVAWSETSRHG